MNDKSMSRERIDFCRNEYLRRRRRRNLSLIPFFVAAGLAWIARLSPNGVLGVPFSIVGPVAWIVVLAVILYRILEWRCPACNGFMGLVDSPRYCPQCGFFFEDDPDPRSGREA